MTADPVEAQLRQLDRAVAEQRHEAALAVLRALPDPIRTSFPFLAREADLLGKLGRHDEEVALYDRLMAMQPDTIGLWGSKANALRTLGRTAEAVAVLRDSLARRPDYLRPWWQLSDMKDFCFDEVDVATMTSLLATQDDEARIPLHFALGKAYEDRGQAGEAFDHYARGNALRAASFGRDRIGVTGRVDRTIATFTPAFLADRAGGGHPSDAPIFIVGLQRSGSTLVEQILASHPEIEGTSELPVMPQIMRDIAADDRLPPGTGMERLTMLDPAQRRAYGQAYLDRAAAYRRSDRLRFVDKNPANWTHVGLIRLILPRARIIDARRHPLATGLSIFRQNFGGGGFFAFGLDTIGAYYRQYLRLMTHFERVDPGAIHRLVNEVLIADFEPEVRRLLDHVGVPFDPACLDFHNNRRAVATPSAAQVRRPINRDGVDQWRAFEPMLEPLKAALGAALEDWNAPPGAYRDED